MKPIDLRSLPALLFLAVSPLARTGASAERLDVVATIPDLADLVQEIGGDRVEVTSIARGKENLHAVVARPSHLVAMSRADLFVEVGLSLEVGFVPGLLEGARNRRIRPGEPGFVNVSEGWTPIEVPTDLSRRAGDIHPQGNPHLNMDPRAGKHMARKIFEGLVRVDPGSRALYQERFDALDRRLDEAMARWTASAQSWKGQKIVVYHLEYNYLAAAHGLEVVGSIEAKPGIPPTPNHIAELIADMKAAGCKTILTAIWSNNNDVARIAEKTGAKIVELPNQCGAMKGAETWIGMMDLVHQRLAAVFGNPPEGD
jgi:ABC-type Zn uptake system ZnuABC Zn-binding protein ZnuA